jgi:hypothetical protein
MPLTADQTKVFDLVSDDYTPAIITAAASALDAGELHQIEEAAGFPLEDVASGAKYAAVIKADQVRAIKAAEAIDAGDDVYYDLSATVVTKVSTANVLMGTCLQDAALGDADVLMTFDGRTKTLV